jgi:hypothetical protein
MSCPHLPATDATKMSLLSPSSVIRMGRDVLPATLPLCQQDAVISAACSLLQGGEMGCGGAASDILIFVRATRDLVNVLHTIFCYT